MNRQSGVATARDGFDDGGQDGDGVDREAQEPLRAGAIKVASMRGFVAISRSILRTLTSFSA